MNRNTDLGNKRWYVYFGLFAAVIGVVSSIIALIQFTTAKNLPDFLGGPTLTVVQPTEAVSIVKPAAASKVDPNPTIPPTAKPQSPSMKWSSPLSVRIPTLNEIRAEKPISLWDASLINVRDRYEPGVEIYAGKAQVGTEYLLPIYWCATTTDLLTQNMDTIQTTFHINDEVVPEKYIFTYNYDTKTGWKCNYNAVVLGGWAKDVQYKIEIKRTLSSDISDGKSSYAAGEYSHQITVSVP